LEAKDGGDLTGVAWNYASDRFMLASASHDGTVRLWVTPGPHLVLECEAEPDPEPEEGTSHDHKRQETMSTEAHSSSGRGTPTPFPDEPQSTVIYTSPPEELDAPPSAPYRRVDSPLSGDFDTSRPPQPNSFRQAQ